MYVCVENAARWDNNKNVSMPNKTWSCCAITLAIKLCSGRTMQMYTKYIFNAYEGPRMIEHWELESHFPSFFHFHSFYSLTRSNREEMSGRERCRYGQYCRQIGRLSSPCWLHALLNCMPVCAYAYTEQKLCIFYDAQRVSSAEMVFNILNNLRAKLWYILSFPRGSFFYCKLCHDFNSLSLWDLKLRRWCHTYYAEWRFFFCRKNNRMNRLKIHYCRITTNLRGHDQCFRKSIREVRNTNKTIVKNWMFFFQYLFIFIPIMRMELLYILLRSGSNNHSMNLFPVNSGQCLINILD